MKLTQHDLDEIRQIAQKHCALQKKFSAEPPGCPDVAAETLLQLLDLAEDGLTANERIRDLETDNTFLQNENFDLERENNLLKSELDAANERAEDYAMLDAVGDVDQ